MSQFRQFLRPNITLDFIKGIILWYKLNEGSGSIAGDSSGNNNNGSLINSPTWITGALELDGSTQYISVPNPSSYDMTLGGGGFTICCWVNPNSVSLEGDIFTKSDSSYNDGSKQFLITSDGKYGLDYSFVGGFKSNTVLTVGIWQFIAVTQDASGNVIFYYNSATDGTATTTTHPDPVGAVCQIGTKPADASNQFYGGGIDDFRFYQRALTGTEILKIYNNRIVKSLIPTMTSDTTPNGIASASVEPLGLEAWRAFSGDSSRRWHDIVQGGAGWIQYQFPIQYVVKFYTFFNNVGVSTTCSFVFQGSNDGSTWDTLDTQTSVFIGTSTAFSQNISNSTEYLYYRLTFSSSSNGVAWASLFQMNGY